MSHLNNSWNGWLIIDKPYNMGSTQVVSRLKRALSPSKIGHAGTLDPLATGILPIAVGQATKLIPYVMDGRKIYEFQITWGAETDTDDQAGVICRASDKRPSEADIKSILPEFLGRILQQPPAYSALKIDGKRAYALARAGEAVTLQPRPVDILSLELLSHTSTHADFRVICGKGTYVRALGRDIGRRLGCLGYITKLRRTACGPFTLSDVTDLALFTETGQMPQKAHFLPLETALDALPALSVEPDMARRLTQGQRIPVSHLTTRIPTDLAEGCVARLMDGTHLLGLVKLNRGILHPFRIFRPYDADNGLSLKSLTNA